MKQVRIFTDSNDEDLEAGVNEWLRENPEVLILRFVVTESFYECWSLTVTILYDGGISTVQQAAEDSER